MNNQMNILEAINSEVFFVSVIPCRFDRESCWVLVEVKGFEVLQLVQLFLKEYLVSGIWIAIKQLQKFHLNSSKIL